MSNVHIQNKVDIMLGPGDILTVDPMASENVASRREVHPQDHSDPKQDEGNRSSLQESLS